MIKFYDVNIEAIREATQEDWDRLWSRVESKAAIRNAALEEAAKCSENADFDCYGLCACEIRALKTKETP